MAEQTEEVEPVVWRISPDNIEHAVQVLRDANKARVDRLHILNGANLDKWPGYQIRVYVKDGSRLFQDRDHAEEIDKLIKKLLRDGVRAGLRLHVQW